MEFLAAAAATPGFEQLDAVDYAWMAFAAVVFVYLGRRVFRAGGDAVDSAPYGQVELVLALCLSVWFIALGSAEFLLPPPTEKVEMTITTLVFNAAMIVILTGGVVLTLTVRERSFDALFGLDRQPVWKAIVYALVLTFAAYPIIEVGALLTQRFASGPDDVQEIVKFFRSAGQGREKAAVVLTAVLLAPLSEELFFRGLIYGVAKKYCGLAAAIVFNSALFAFLHGSLPSFGGLFALAVCLTLAYEFSGSLYVPIAMHACFNASQLILILLGPDAPKP